MPSTTYAMELDFLVIKKGKTMTQAIVQGCKAGTLAGLIWGLLILGFVSPIIQKAEVYEQKAETSEVHEHHDTATTAASAIIEHSHHHHHHTDDADDFQPNFWQRPLLTVLGTILMGIAFGIFASVGLSLLLHYYSTTWERLFRSPLKWGLSLGLIGFAIFQGLPALGIRPALPGVIGAEEDHLVRQNWWLLSVFCSTAALSLASLGWKVVKNSTRSTQKVLFVILIITSAAVVIFPFGGYGVPVYSKESVTPMGLQETFICVSLIVSLLFWLIMSTTLTHLLKRQDNSPL